MSPGRLQFMTSAVVALALFGLTACGQDAPDTQTEEPAAASRDSNPELGSDHEMTANEAADQAALDETREEPAENIPPAFAEETVTQNPTSDMSFNGGDAGEDLYQRGFYPEALDQWRQDADAGNGYAAYRLGVEYFDAHHVDRDLEMAARYQQLASELGNAAGMFELASYYEVGLGVPQNMEQAAAWYLESARRGYPPAQHNIATLYEDGVGVPQDLMQAYLYYSLAIEGGFRVNFERTADGQETVFVDPRRFLRTQMTPDQIAEAEAMVASFTPTP